MSVQAPQHELGSPGTLPSEAKEIPSCELTILMPCLNEAETLERCIQKAQNYLREHHVDGEVVIADNGSTDGSQEIARRNGARVVDILIKGYGAALQGGIEAARGQYIAVGDSDDSYDFTSLNPFLVKLREGYDLVMGNRFRGGIYPGAMPPLHRYFGNPVLTTIGRILFHSGVGDFHCGLRAFRKDSILKLDLRTTGMEFASEMVVKATLHGLRVAEVPTTLRPDGRSRPPHLRSWRDGWRHLRFMLVYSPNWLFLYPGVFLILLGSLIGIVLFPGPVAIAGATYDIHTLLYAHMAIIVGFQSVLFSMFTKIFAITEGLLPENPQFMKVFRYLNLEVGLILGSFTVLAGLCGVLYSLFLWEQYAYGPLDPSRTMRLVIPSATAVSLGCEMILGSFFFSVLGLRRR